MIIDKYLEIEKDKKKEEKSHHHKSDLKIKNEELEEIIKVN